MNIKSPRRYKYLIVVLIVLLLINIFTIYFFEIEISRIIRVVSSLVILLYFLYTKGFWQKFVLYALLIFVIRDFFILEYEIDSFKTTSFLLTILAYISIILITLRKLKISKSTPIIILFVFIIVALNAFNVYYLSDVVKAELNNEIQFILFFIQGAVLILLAFAGFMYNERYKGKTPLIYLYIVLSLILSDLCGLAAYFFGYEPAYYPERIFYIIGLALLLNFSFNRNTQKSNNILDEEKEYIL